MNDSEKFSLECNSNTRIRSNKPFLGSVKDTTHGGYMESDETFRYRLLNLSIISGRKVEPKPETFDIEIALVNLIELAQLGKQSEAIDLALTIQTQFEELTKLPPVEPAVIKPGLIDKAALLEALKGEPIFYNVSQIIKEAPVVSTAEETYSYHDVDVKFNDKRINLFNSSYGYLLTCSRVEGWRLWHQKTLIAGEYDEVRLEVFVKNVQVLHLGENSNG